MFAADGSLSVAMLQKALVKEVVFKLICLGGWIRVGRKNWRFTNVLTAFSWHPFLEMYVLASFSLMALTEWQIGLPIVLSI